MIKKLFKRFDRLVLLRQSIFGLPWILSAAILAYFQSGKMPSFKTLLAVTCAFATARLAGMCFNRYLDRFIDAKNPRTSDRCLPRGEISPLACLVQGIGFLALFFVISIYLKVASLSAGVAVLLIIYSLTKRFTTLCHIVLGFIQAFGPLLTWIIISGEYRPAALLLGLALCCSIAASDIIYACQDVSFDRNERLYSFPAKYGVDAAIKFSSLLYLISFSSLFMLGLLLQLHFAYFLSVFLIGACFTLSSKITDYDARFRFCNSMAGMILLGGTIGEFIWRVLL